MTGRRFHGLLMALVAIWPAVAASAADLPVEQKTGNESGAVSTPATAPVLAPPDATCLEWSDGCRTCQKPSSGETACSNVGIACIPQPPRCLRR